MPQEARDNNPRHSQRPEHAQRDPGQNSLHILDPEEWQQIYRIRSWCEGDGPACLKLYHEAQAAGYLAPNDTALDMEDIPAAYLADTSNHFWVAETTDAATAHADILGHASRPGLIVGMIGVQHHEEGVGEIRRLRVHPAHRRRHVGSRLLETAIKFCRDQGCLKVALDTYVQHEAALALFRRFSFRHGRTRKVHGKELLYFYLDLYAQNGNGE